MQKLIIFITTLTISWLSKSTVGNDSSGIRNNGVYTIVSFGTAQSLYVFYNEDKNIKEVVGMSGDSYSGFNLWTATEMPSDGEYQEFVFTFFLNNNFVLDVFHPTIGNLDLTEFTIFLSSDDRWTLQKSEIVNDQFYIWSVRDDKVLEIDSDGRIFLNAFDKESNNQLWSFVEQFLPIDSGEEASTEPTSTAEPQLEVSPTQGPPTQVPTPQEPPPQEPPPQEPTPQGPPPQEPPSQELPAQEPLPEVFSEESPSVESESDETESEEPTPIEEISPPCVIESGKTYIISSAENDMKVLGFQAMQMKNNAKIIAAESISKTDERARWIATETDVKNKFFFSSAKNQEYVLDSSTRRPIGRLIIFKQNPTRNQVWSIAPTFNDDGSCFIMTIKDDSYKYAGVDRDNNVAIEDFDNTDGSKHQHWVITEYDNSA